MRSSRLPQVEFPVEGEFCPGDLWVFDPFEEPLPGRREIELRDAVNQDTARWRTPTAVAAVSSSWMWDTRASRFEVVV
jgi:hypothetical protein